VLSCRPVRPPLPFEFTVLGPPVSGQAQDRGRVVAWQEIVRTAAASRWPDGVPPLDGNLRIAVCYYHDRITVRLDNDNIIKPIQDALAGLVYDNDHRITDTAIRKTCLDGPFRVRGLSSVLAAAFVDGREFLHIVIDAAPSHVEILK
jgi:crossover junction endodeoxyribonuclease RusA